MKLTGLHLLLTYKCTYECDHCFVWGSPWQRGTMTLQMIHRALRQAEELGTVRWIYFEGGEPFLYYAVLLAGVQAAVEMGFKVGIVSNAYWATDQEDALECLRPLQGMIEDLSLSQDLYHENDTSDGSVAHAARAAEFLEIPVSTIRIDQPVESASREGGPDGGLAVMYRGRAAAELVGKAGRTDWREFDACPHEDLAEPGRLHLDPLGNLHLCQGIVIGNIGHTPLREICSAWDPASDPVVGPLLAGGPAGLAATCGGPGADEYADACHLCYEVRRAARDRFPETLLPDQVYGV